MPKSMAIEGGLHHLSHWNLSMQEEVALPESIQRRVAITGLSRKFSRRSTLQGLHAFAN
jgi:hypothetical protein